ncbi:hypothetical protein ACVWWK_005204 [Bradyrhizobium sp. LB9.1b]
MVSAQATSEPAPEPRPGPDRNALALCPFDKVGHDQEVARVFHAHDDVELERQALFVVLVSGARRQAVHLQTVAEPLLGLPLQFGRLDRGGIGACGSADREERQDRLARHRAERAALGDLHRRGQRLRNIGEQHRHLGAGLEAVVGRELLALGLCDQPPAGDAEQRVMRFVIVGRGEIRLVGRNQRQALGVSDVDQAAFDSPLLLGVVALQLDVEAVAKQAGQTLAARGGNFGLPRGKRQRDRPVRTARQHNQAFGLALQPVKLDVGGVGVGRLQERARVQPHQAAVAALLRGQQYHARGQKRVARTGILVAEIDRDLAADDRLDAGARHLVGELQRTEHVVGIGQRQGRLMVFLRKLGELGDLDRALEQRIGRVNVKVDKSGARHGRVTASCRWMERSPAPEASCIRQADSPHNGGVSPLQSPRRSGRSVASSRFSPRGTREPSTGLQNRGSRAAESPAPRLRSSRRTARSRRVRRLLRRKS